MNANLQELCRETERKTDRIVIGVHRSYLDPLVDAMRAEDSGFKPRRHIIPATGKRERKFHLFPFDIIKSGERINIRYPLKELKEPDKSRLVILNFKGRFRATLAAIKNLLTGMFGKSVDDHCFIKSFEVRWDLWVHDPKDIEKLRRLLVEGLTLKNCPQQLTRKIKNTTYFGINGYRTRGSKGLKVYPRENHESARLQEPPFNFLRLEINYNQSFIQKHKIGIENLTTLHLDYDPLDYIQYRKLRHENLWKQINSETTDFVLSRKKSIAENPLASLTRQALIQAHTVSLLSKEISHLRMEDHPITNQVTAYRSLVKRFNIRPDRTNYYFPRDEDKQDSVVNFIRNKSTYIS